MATRAAAEKWLSQLTNLPTASGHEDAVAEWVRAWASRRDDIRLAEDTGGNLLVSQRGRNTRSPVIAVAHMDHPAFVALDSTPGLVSYEFRGSVNSEYFADAAVEFVVDGERHAGRVIEHDEATRRGLIRLSGRMVVEPGSIGMWVFDDEQAPADRFAAPACDDLAGVAASLAALDRARGSAHLRHLSVLLTRAEEVGLVGAIHAAKTGSIRDDARLISIETSRELPNAPIGEGPIIRVGDAVTMFDRELSNAISSGAIRAGLRHQRKLMDGGGCEATAFGVYGFRATGLCLALGNWHNRGNLDLVEAGRGSAVPKREQISLSDFHGLIDLLLVAVTSIDTPDSLTERFEASYEDSRHFLR